MGHHRRYVLMRLTAIDLGDVVLLESVDPLLCGVVLIDDGTAQMMVVAWNLRQCR